MAIAKQIEGFPDYYVSSVGNVWREKNNGFYLKLRPNKQGLVQIYANGERNLMYIHRLVAQAFVPVPEQYADMSIDELDVHHINFDHSDNRASNLMWLTKAEHQQLHRYSEVTKQRRSEAKKGKNRSKETKQRISETMKGRLFTEEHKRKLSEAKKGKHHSEETKQKMSEAKEEQSKVVAQYTKEGYFAREYSSIAEASRQTKVNKGSICSCCSGRYKSAGGFIWRYVS